MGVTRLQVALGPNPGKATDPYRPPMSKVHKGRFGRPFLPGEGGKRWYVPRNLLPPPSMWQYIRYPTLPRWYGRRTGKPDSPLKYLFSGTPEIVLNPELKRAFPHAIALLRQLQGEEAFGLLPATKGSRRVVIMVHSSARGTYQYQTTKNFRNRPEKLALRKYSPLTRKHEHFHEK